MNKTMFLLTFLSPLFAFASGGGMISSEPTSLEPVRACSVKSMDPTFPSTATRIVQLREEALSRTVFELQDANGDRITFLPVDEVPGSDGQEFNIVEREAYSTKVVGYVSFSKKEISEQYPNVGELVIGDCEYFGAVAQ